MTKWLSGNFTSSLAREAILILVKPHLGFLRSPSSSHVSRADGFRIRRRLHHPPPSHDFEALCACQELVEVGDEDWAVVEEVGDEIQWSVVAD